mgnify:FL=1
MSTVPDDQDRPAKEPTVIVHDVVEAAKPSPDSNEAMRLKE